MTGGRGLDREAEQAVPEKGVRRRFLTHSSAMARRLATIDTKPFLRSRSPSLLKFRSEKRSERRALPRSNPFFLHRPGGSGVSDPRLQKKSGNWES